jgi:paraquat-inducible protein B
MVSQQRNVNVDPVKRKVISELFFAPSVVLPIVGGISAGMLSWAIGGNNSLTMAAAAGILGGLGWMMTRIIFKIEAITEDAMRFEQEQAIKAENKQLDELEQLLIGDGDDRTQDYLTLLRSVRQDFQETASQPGVQMRSARVREQVNTIFHATVDQLRHSYKLWQLSRSLNGDARRKVMESRENVMKEIGTTVDRLHNTVLQFRELIREDKKVDLASMREELEATMRVARRTEEKMREIENTTSSNRSSISE